MSSIILDEIRKLCKQELISDLDYRFTIFIQQLAGKQATEALALASLLVSHLTTQGHICVDLAHYAKQKFPPDTEQALTCPSLENWLDTLQNCPVVGKAGDYQPLILDGQRLYLYRYWQYEQQLLTGILQRLKQTSSNALNTESLERLFPHTAANDLQKYAAQVALRSNFCIISGGAGTGKTTTVAKILALLLEQHLEQPSEQKSNLSIALAAPTGKAATRLKETLSRAHLDCSDAIKALMPQQTYTLHRLLGAIPDTPNFRHHADNPLLYDVVVIDEASMVDLALMAKLLNALSSKTRLILLGDKDQLASVEIGSVLGDICAGAHLPAQTPEAQRLQESIVLLKTSHRFTTDSGIGAVAEAVKQGDADLALQHLRREQGELSWQNLPENSLLLLNSLKSSLLAGFQKYLQAENPEQALQALDEFRVLSALRRGRYGVENLNRLIEQLFNEQNLINLSFRWYHRRPILITCNDYNLNLFNGDIGVIFRKQNEIKAFFRDENNSIRSFYPNRLPKHETVYAMTIHKSQGSEFEKVLLLLPDQDSPLLTRELIYTGITRAKQAVEVHGKEVIFRNAVKQRIQRNSGLKAALWGNNDK
jgi:exodeoxyribonuclease V alpha subunit